MLILLVSFGRKNSFDIEKCLAHGRLIDYLKETQGKNSFDIEKCLAQAHRRAAATATSRRAADGDKSKNSFDIEKCLAQARRSQAR